MASHRWDPKCSPPNDLVRPVPVDPRGELGPTRGQASGPKWRRTSPGLYVPADTPTDVPEQRILEASKRMPAYAAVTGWAACRLHGARFHDGLEPDGRTLMPVPVVVGGRGWVRRSGGIAITYESLDPDDIVIVAGIPAVRPDRATFDAMRRTPCVRDAVVALECSTMAELVSIRMVADYTRKRAGRTRVGLAREALQLAIEHSRSPNETRLRLIVRLDAGIAGPLHANCAVYARDGKLLGIADLLDEEAGLVIEFDGAEHRRAGRHARDVIKDDDLRDCGLEVLRVTGSQLSDRPTLVERIHAARGRSRFVKPDARAWVAQPCVDTLHERILARETLREIWSGWEPA